MERYNMKKKTTIANAMDGQSKTFVIRNADGEQIPGIRISMEYSHHVPVEVSDAVLEGYAIFQGVILRALAKNGCIESED